MKRAIPWVLVALAFVVMVVVLITSNQNSRNASSEPTATPKVTETAVPYVPPGTSPSASVSPEPSSSGSPKACKKTDIGSDDFTNLVLKFEQANYNPDPKGRDKVLAEVATPEYISANKQPASVVDFGGLYPLVVRECTSVKWTDLDSTGKVRSVVVVAELKTFRNHVLVNGPFLDQTHTTTWILTDTGWKVHAIVLK